MHQHDEAHPPAHARPLQRHLGFHRKADKYKKNIFDIYRDWHHPQLRRMVLEYNYEDVFYLARIKQTLFEKYALSRQWLQEIALGSNSIAALIVAYLWEHLM